MRDAERRHLSRLIDWRPAHGVISIYFEIDPGDRSGAWRLQLKDGLAALREPEDHEGKIALRETVARVMKRFEPEEPPPGRAQVGFVEVAREEGEESWTSFQIGTRDTLVKHGPRSYLRPLIALHNRGRERPVLAISAERIRGWIWERGKLEPQPRWGAELAIYDGRERKAPAVADPASGHATSSSGRDQYGQRLEANRKRFLEDFARGLEGDERVRGAEVVVIGEAPYLDEFVAGLASNVDVWKVEGPDVINEPDATVAERVGDEVERALDEYESELVKTIVDAAMSSSGRGSAGVDETSEALVEGRVEHLALAPNGEISERDFNPLARESVADAEGFDGSELLIELALRTSADVTPVTAAAADALREHGGVAALLRY